MEEKKWQARITVNGKQKHLGWFKTEVEAINKRKEVLNEQDD
jgi:hypothetical protein